MLLKIASAYAAIPPCEPEQPAPFSVTADKSPKSDALPALAIVT